MSNLNNKAVQLSKEGRLDEAINLFLEAIKENPNDGYLNFNIALVYIKKEQYRLAIPYLEKSVKINEQDDNLRELGVCYLKLKEFESARNILVNAVNKYGTSDSENVLGVYYFQIENYNLAKEHFEISVKLNPLNRDAWFNLSDTYSELGMDREAKIARYKFEELGKR